MKIREVSGKAIPVALRAIGRRLAGRLGFTDVQAVEDTLERWFTSHKLSRAVLQRPGAAAYWKDEDWSVVAEVVESMLVAEREKVRRDQPFVEWRHVGSRPVCYQDDDGFFKKPGG